MTSWNVDINSRDKEGLHSPLHLGVISGNPRIVRRLLLKGADRNITDKNSNKPIDLARDNNFLNIERILVDPF